MKLNQLESFVHVAEHASFSRAAQARHGPTGAEWLTSGRLDMGLVYNPEPSSAIEIQPLREERICLVSPVRQARSAPVPPKELSNDALVMPERGHSFRTLMESAAAMHGVQLNVEWEVSSVPAILDLVTAGLGHAALAEDAIRPFQHLKRLALTPFTQPEIRITLCLVTAAHRRATTLRRRTEALLAERVHPA